MSQSVLNENGPTPDVPAPANTTAAAVRPAIGFILPLIVLIAYWGITEASYRFEMGMFYRFVTRMITLLITLIFFLVWGFTRRHFTWGQRFLAFAMILISMLVGGALSHPATGTPAIAMMGLPFVLTLSVAWLWLAARRGQRTELVGIGVISVVVFGLFSLVRWDGMDGRQRPLLSWRWTASSEEQFLQQQAKNSTAISTEQLPVLVESPEDWCSFRGGNRENVVKNVELSDWSESRPKELWRRRIGPGWSSVIAVGDFLFTQEQRGEREAVICYQASSGDEVWVHTSQTSQERFDESLSGSGPRATPAFHENRIYVYGAKCLLECLDATNGEAVWTQAVLKITDAPVPQWGSSSSPAVVDDLVVVFAGGKDDKSLLAFDQVSGELRWSVAGGTVSYSTPQDFTISGVRQLVMHDEAGLSGHRIESGERLWHLPSPNAGSFQPMLQPHQIGDDQLLVNWDAGLLCCQIQKSGEEWNLKSLWTSNRVKPSFNDFVIHDNNIYALDDGILCCADLKNGQRRWKRGRYGFGQLLLLPELKELLVLAETGDVVRVATDSKEHRELGSFTALHSKTWNHPILARGRLVVRNSEEMACYEISTAPAVATTN